MGKRMGAIALIIWLSLAGWFGWMQPTWASVHTYPEGAGAVMVRSLQTLRDDRDQAWQLVLFNRSQHGAIESVHLRLVGFPGKVIVQHPDPLRISSSTAAWTAPDCTAEVPLLPLSTGEYDVQPAIAALPNNSPLQITLATTGGDRTLKIPPYAVREWREVAQMLPNSDAS